MTVATHEVGALVGRWARLRPTDGPLVEGARRLRVVAATGPDVLPDVDMVEVAVVSNLETTIRCETRDRRALHLAGRTVVVELGATEAMLRVVGTVRVLVEHPLPVVLAVALTGDLEHLQRRRWVRARVQVPVEILTEAARTGEPPDDAREDAPGPPVRAAGGLAVAGGGGAADRHDTFRATTVDLSGGGARMKTAEPLWAGENLHLLLWLPAGPVELESLVLDTAGDGTARVVFEQMPESVAKRLMRFVFDVQVHSHRLAGP